VVAADAQAYVAAAARLASEAPATRSGRAAARARMAASPLCDIGHYVADLQDLFECMWRLHSEGDPRRVIRAGKAQCNREDKDS
jgi:predicted O-linked N-acetylglucosamine transferase (SPINDLY family)